MDAHRVATTAADREWVNLNAAVNTDCPTHEHLQETDCLNAQRMRALYEKLLAAYSNGPLLYIICDNVRYYCNWEMAECLRDKLTN